MSDKGSAYDFTFTTIDGQPLPMSTFQGKAVLVVNTASKCGLTPQYEGLQSLYSEMKSEGLVVLGVPCNQFAGQEPGSETEIRSFCETNFDVDFPLTSKVEVKGDGAHPFYRWVRERLGEEAEPVWNFHKILIGKDGQPVKAFGPRTEPKDDTVKEAIAAALRSSAAAF
ncbi:MAG: glutathione peroxidase [Phenylobacterium sp.]|jgi:glutathione peroxidase|uniref:glutathione peroxidase n=1 Tax=Phenylobacterium sp. TaxID=1871053 RepID=UPI002A35AB25|nr:glutathione peroxidase [Phenylobacterium sp.]MDX9997322.1 glutathione peroxidase [Phenylobacterium sp.]